MGASITEYLRLNPSRTIGLVSPLTQTLLAFGISNVGQHSVFDQQDQHAWTTHFVRCHSAGKHPGVGDFGVVHSFVLRYPFL